MANSSGKTGNSTSAVFSPPLCGDSFEKYQGEWNFDTAAHLLRRATFGAHHLQIKEAAAKSMDEVIADLFSDPGLPEEPINYNYPNDPTVPLGESWVNQAYASRNDSQDIQMQIGSRVRSLRAWILRTILNSGLNIREKMTLFWHNHFVTQLTIVRDPNYIYNYNHTLRQFATGNFRELTARMTIDPAMLVYLNGNQNNRNAPNENYARELFELFTVGKGELAGPGDYSTFTEDDVIAAAKVLTGWRDVGFLSSEGVPAGARYIDFLHDRSTKSFSHRFDNRTISNQGRNEYRALIDMIFEQEEVSRFISRKLYRWFVYYDIDEQVESQIIEPMAALIRDNDYEIEPALRALLSSEHFYGICSRGPMIKNPIDFFSQMMIQHDITFPPDLMVEYNLLARISFIFESLEMVYFEPPNVAGWKAYYQEPQYYRIWINAVTLTNRQNITNQIVSGNIDLVDYIFTIDLLEYIAGFDDPLDPNNLILELTRYIFPNGITDLQKNYLKEILIPGLPDFEWTVEYSDYLDDPDNEQTKRAVLAKLQDLFKAAFSMPEYYLS